MTQLLESRTAARGRVVVPRGWSDGAVRNWCIVPVLVLLIAFNVFPLFASLGISFTNFSQARPGEAEFVGMANYGELVNDRVTVWPAFVRTAGLVAASVGLETLIGFCVAMLLVRKFWGREAIVAILLIPMMLSPAVMAAFWKYMFHPDWGVVNWLLGTHWRWDGYETRGFWAVVIVEVWMWTPFMMLLSLAGLNSIPVSLYEAAEVDRAGAWFRFRNITLPLAAPLVTLGVVFRVMDTFRLFDTAAVLNAPLSGQPTTLVSVLLYIKGIKNASGNLGEGTALAYLMLIVAVAIGNVAVRYLDRLRGGR